MPCWYFEKTELSKTPSTTDGIDNLTEARYRCEGVKLMIDAGSALGLRYDVCATATVYFHRFYMFHSFCDFHRYVTGSTCLFLAAKLEENTVTWTRLIETVKSLLTEPQFAVFGRDPEEEVMAIEKILLETLKFDLVVDLPYNHLLKFIKLLKGEPSTIEQLLKMSWTFINDCLCTTLCIQWEPELVALSLLYLSCHLIKFPVADWIGKPADYNGKWYQYLVSDINLGIIENICRQALGVYSKFRQQEVDQTATSSAPIALSRHQSEANVLQRSKSPPQPDRSASQAPKACASVTAPKSRSTVLLTASQHRRRQRIRSQFAKAQPNPALVDNVVQVATRMEKQPRQGASQPPKTRASVTAVRCTSTVRLTVSQLRRQQRRRQQLALMQMQSQQNPAFVMKVVQPTSPTPVIIESSPEKENDVSNFQTKLRRLSSRPSPSQRNRKRSQSFESDDGMKRKRRRSPTPERRRHRSSSASPHDRSRRRHASVEKRSVERRSRSRKRSRSKDSYEAEFELRKQQCLAILHSGKMLSKQEFEMVQSFMHRESSDLFSKEQFESLKRSLEIESSRQSGHASSSQESLNSADRRVLDVPEKIAVPTPYSDYRYVSAALPYHHPPPPLPAPLYMNASPHAGQMQYNIVSHAPLHHQLGPPHQQQHVVGVPMHHAAPVGFRTSEHTPPRYYLSSHAPPDAGPPPSFIQHPGFSPPFYNQTVQQAPYIPTMAPRTWLPP